MQTERMIDQAEGLRRLLAQSAARVVTVAGAQAGLGVTTLVASLALVLEQHGREVLILDENLAHDNVGNRLNLKPRYDLLHAVRQDKSLPEILLQASHGIRVLPVARAMQALPKLSQAERLRMQDLLASASHVADVVLVDAATVGPRFISANLSSDQPLLLVINANPSSITESYALIKRMALQDGRRNFGVVVNRAAREADARGIFENVQSVARRHLDVSVKYLGYVPHDNMMERAMQLCLPLADAFPASPAVPALDRLASNLLLLPGAGVNGSPYALGVKRPIRNIASLDLAYAE